MWSKSSVSFIEEFYMKRKTFYSVFKSASFWPLFGSSVFFRIQISFFLLSAFTANSFATCRNKMVFSLSAFVWKSSNILTFNLFQDCFYIIYFQIVIWPNFCPQILKKCVSESLSVPSIAEITWRTIRITLSTRLNHVWIFRQLCSVILILLLWLSWWHTRFKAGIGLWEPVSIRYWHEIFQKWSVQEMLS